MRLTPYRKKRDFGKTPEPKPKVKKGKGGKRIFVVQEHHARRLHYDLRLEVSGVLKSWAIPKEPAMNPGLKRLAIQVEDHPYDYKDFEGTIPSGYGAGTVAIWDRGTFQVKECKTDREIERAIRKGHLTVELEGKRLKGEFHLVRMKENQWLFVKKKEEEKGFLTHLEKMYWPKDKISKGDLISYYAAVSKWILPHLKDRPVSLKRYPNGIEEAPFFQKNLADHPDWIETFPLSREKKRVNYLLIQNEKSLLYAANLGSIELHPFFSKVSTLERPDFVVFDLDPKGAPFSQVIEVAQMFHEVLEEIDVPSSCKTSGATGLHVAVPLGAKVSYEKAKQFALLVANIVHQKLPKITTLERSVAKRKGKIYIDCLQNNLGHTLVAPYSVRARPGAPVSTPLRWSEVKKGLDAKKWTIKTVPARLKKEGDLYAPVLGKGIRLETVLKKLKSS